MFKSQSEFIKIIQQDDKILSALDGLSQIAPHLDTYVQEFLIEYLNFKKTKQPYEKVHLLLETADTFELVQIHSRVAPKNKTSFRTSNYSLKGDWTVIAQVVIDHCFNVTSVILLSRDIVESNHTGKPWTIGKCLQLGRVIYPEVDN